MALTNDFKIKNGLTVTDSISAGSCIEADSFEKHGGTSSQFLKADGSVDSSAYTTCCGDVTGIDAGTAITVTDGATATPTVSVTSACNTAWNAKTTCLGTVTSIATGTGIGGGTITESGTLTVGAGTGLCATADGLCVATACNTAWNGVYSTVQANSATWDNVGDITEVVAGSQMTGGGASGCVTLNTSLSTGGIGSGTYGNTNDNCKIDTITVDEFGRVAAVACGPTGDISQVVAGTNLTGGGTAGCVTINMATGGIGSGTYGSTADNTKIDTITVDAYGRVTAVACGSTGDIAGVTAGSQMTGGGTSGTPTLNVSLSTGGIGSGTYGSTSDSSKIDQITVDEFGRVTNITTGATGSSCTNGTVTSIATSTGLTGGTITSSGTLSIDSTCNTTWNSAYVTTKALSGCSGLACVGDVTGIDAGTAITITDGTTATPTVGVTSACNTAWNNKTTCTGTVTSVGTSGGLCGGNITTSGTICIIPACCTEFKGAYTTAKALSACAGLSCVGDITAVTAGNGLTGGATCGAATLNVGAGTAITVAADSVGVTSACNTAWNAKTTCTGTVTSVGGGNGLTGTVTSSGSLNVGAGTGITVNANDVAINSTCNTRWNGTATTVQSNSGSWDQSGCPGLNCTGDITAVTAGTNLTGGGTTGSVTINMATGGVGAGTYGNTGNACKIDTITVDAYGRVTAVACGPTGSTSCTGTVTSVATGSGLTGGTITSSGTLSVDSTVARTNVDETFSCDVTINGDLTVNGDLVCLETIVSTTSALSVTNHGSGPAIVVNQSGTNDIANFTDDGVSVLYIEDGGNVGLTCNNPVQRLDVNGNINTSGDIRVDNNIVVNTGRCFTGVAVQPTTDIADAYIASAATWNAKTTCTGTVTSVNGGSGLTGAVTSSGSLNVGAGTGITVNANDVAINSTCNTTWNSAYTTTKTLSGCAGLACTGDITAVTAGTNLTGGGTSGSVTINMATGGVGAGTYGNTGNACKIDTITVDAYGRVTAVACGPTGSTSCTGTVTCVNGGSGLTGAVTSSGSLNVGAGTGITVNANDVAINSTCNTTWNSAYTTTKALSSCSGLTCTGDITAVTAGNGLTGGASSGAATLNVGAGTAITVAADTVGVTSACNTAWNAKTTCTGTVTSVATGNGISGGTITGSGTLTVGAGTGLTQTSTGLCVSTACNTAWNAKTTCTGTVTSVSGGTGLTGTVTSSGSLAIDTGVVMNLASAQTASGTKNFSGDICVGDQIFHTGDSDTYLRFGTNAFCIYTGGEQHVCVNTGGVVVNESGNSNDFRVESDTNTHMLFVDGSANAIGINCSTPGSTLAVNGSFTATCKSFLIDNPVTGGQLKYGVLEGNEHGVTVRGTTSSGTIELPEEWEWLVHEDSVTVQLTPVGAAHTPYVVCQNNNEVVVCTHGCYNYNIYGTRKDVEPLEVNIL